MCHQLSHHHCHSVFQVSNPKTIVLFVELQGVRMSSAKTVGNLMLLLPNIEYSLSSQPFLLQASSWGAYWVLVFLIEALAQLSLYHPSRLCCGNYELDFKGWAILGLLYFIFVFSILKLLDKILPMSGFDLRIPGVWSDRSSNWATNTALR